MNKLFSAENLRQTMNTSLQSRQLLYEVFARYALVIADFGCGKGYIDHAAAHLISSWLR